MSITYMKKLLTYIALISLAMSCTPHDPVDINPSIVNSDFVNGHFSFVNGYNQFGVPANPWAGKSKISFYYINHSESGNPQGKVVWSFGEMKDEVKAWWRFDEAKQMLAIFGERGTESFLSIPDDHFVMNNRWYPVQLTEEGFINFRECMSDCIQWQFERQADAGEWVKN